MNPKSSKTENRNPQSAMDLVQERVKQLRENTDFVCTLFDNLTGYAIIAADFDGNILAYNEGARQIYGYTPQEVIGNQNIEIFFPSGLIEAGELQKIIANLIKDSRFSYEGEKIRKSGESFPAQILFTVTKNDQDKLVGFIEIVEDITKRKKAEEVRQQLQLQQLQLQQLQLQQLERERAEAVRSYQHFLAMSRGKGPAGICNLPHPDDETLSGLIPEYRDIVRSYVRAVRIQEDRPSDRMREFAQRVAAIRARARDVVRLHLGALNAFSEQGLPDQQRALSNDARLVLVELMGTLMDIYQNVPVPRKSKKERQG